MRRLILDTDLGNDIDDVVALCCMYALARKRQIDFRDILISKPHQYSAPYCDFLSRYHGLQPNIGRAPSINLDEADRYVSLYPFLAGKWYAKPLMLRQDFDPAQDVLRQALTEAEEPVTMVMIGLSTNLAAFLQDESDRELFHNKVERIVIMAGNFARKVPEFNIVADLEAFESVLDRSKCEIVFCGWELGNRVRFPFSEMDRLHHAGVFQPLWLSYFAFMDGPHDRPSFDPVTVLYASGQYQHLFGISPPGRVTVSADGSVEFRPDVEGRHRYLTLNGQQAVAVQTEIIDLVTHELRLIRP